MDLWSATYDAKSMTKTHAMGNILMQTDNEGHKISENLLSQLDTEISTILKEAYDRVLKTLTDHKEELDLIAKELLKRKTLYGEEIQKLIEGINKTET